MADTHAPILTSIVPLRVVPDRLRVAITKVLTGWGYTWEDVTLAGTAELPKGREGWVFAVTSGPLAVGDELESAGGRGTGVGVSGYSGGLIPVTPYQAWVYEFLGRRGGGGAHEQPLPPAVPATQPGLPATPPPAVPTTPDTERAVPDQAR